jgi:single-strand DNA-binding protein
VIGGLVNNVILMGRLGQDPELLQLASGGALLRLRLATNEVYLDKNRERQERTEWHDVVLFGPRAEPLSRILCKGAGVLVEGALRTSSWEKDGVRRYRTQVIARDLHLLGSRPRETSAPAERSEIGADLPF